MLIESSTYSITTYPAIPGDLHSIAYVMASSTQVLDSCTFEFSDLIERPIIKRGVYTDTVFYDLQLTFSTTSIFITSLHNNILRYILSCILTSTDVLEENVRSKFPEYFV